MEREKAESGALITLEEPTDPMRQEAWAAGMYEPYLWSEGDVECRGPEPNPALAAREQ